MVGVVLWLLAAGSPAREKMRGRLSMAAEWLSAHMKIIFADASAKPLLNVKCLEGPIT